MGMLDGATNGYHSFIFRAGLYVAYKLVDCENKYPIEKAAPKPRKADIKSGFPKVPKTDE